MRNLLEINLPYDKFATQWIYLESIFSYINYNVSWYVLFIGLTTEKWKILMLWQCKVWIKWKKEEMMGKKWIKNK